jgi:hypothetical protein
MWSEGESLLERAAWRNQTLELEQLTQDFYRSRSRFLSESA